MLAKLILALPVVQVMFSGLAMLRADPEERAAATQGVNRDASFAADREVVHIAGNVSETLLEELTALPRLRELSVATTIAITPEGLAHLANLPALEKLSLSGVNRDGSGIGDAALESIHRLKTLGDLSIRDCGTTDRGIKLLENMPQLTRLTLQDGRVTDAALTSIAKLTRLTYLNLTTYGESAQYGKMQFSADGLRRLSDLWELEELHVIGHAIGKEGFDFPQLKSLAISGALVDDAFAATISQCQDLRYLSLVETRVTPERFKEIAKLKQLKQLSLERGLVNDDAIAHLRTLPNLEHVELKANDIGDETLKHLAGINTLTRLDLNGAGDLGVNFDRSFTAIGYAQLARLPNLKTLWLTGLDVRWTDLTELRQVKQMTLVMPSMSEDDVLELQRALPETLVTAQWGGVSIRTNGRRGP